MAAVSRRDRRRQGERGPRTVEIPDGMTLQAQVLTAQGVEEVTTFRTLAAKRVGVHRWVATVAHCLSPEQAEAFVGGGSLVLLDTSNIMFAGCGCIDCEGQYQRVHSSPCPAGDEWGAET